MRKLLYMFIVLLLCGCHDAYWELGDSFVYDNGYIYYLVSTDYSKGIHEHYEELVPYEVLNFGFDDHYIIVYQKPDSAITGHFYVDIKKESLDSTIQSQGKTDSLEVLLDSMLSIQNCYWIICKKDAKVYGPMTESNFNGQCKKMNITLRWVRDTNQHP